MLAIACVWLSAKPSMALTLKPACTAEATKGRAESAIINKAGLNKCGGETA